MTILRCIYNAHQTLRKAGAVPVIPGRANRKRKVVYDKQHAHGRLRRPSERRNHDLPTDIKRVIGFGA